MRASQSKCSITEFPGASEVSMPQCSSKRTDSFFFHVLESGRRYLYSFFVALGKGRSLASAECMF